MSCLFRSVDEKTSRARTTIEQSLMIKALYRFLWEAAHEGTPLPMPLLPVSVMQHEIADALGIRRRARK